MSLNMNNVKSVMNQREPLPIGSLPARLVRVLDLGLQTQRPYNGQEKKPAYFIRVTFEFPRNRIDIDGESRPMWKDIEFPLSSIETSRCHKWYQKLDPTNEFKGDWGKLITKDCLVLIAHNQGKGKHQGKVFDNIVDIMPTVAGLDVPQLENDPAVFDLTSPNPEVWETLPDWLQDKIKENLEYEGSRLQALVEGTGTRITAKTSETEEDFIEEKVAEPSQDFDDELF